MYDNLFFLRHKPTTHNLDGRFLGRLDILPTANEYVDTQPLFLYKRIIVYCSPLKRCQATADQLRIQLSTVSDISVKILICEDLTERSMGVFEGKLKQDIKKYFPEIFQLNMIDISASPPGGESIEVLLERARRFLYKELSDREGECKVICSHNQILNALVKEILDIDFIGVWPLLTFEYGQLIRLEHIMQLLPGQG